MLGVKRFMQKRRKNVWEAGIDNSDDDIARMKREIRRVWVGQRLCTGRAWTLCDRIAKGLWAHMKSNGVEIGTLHDLKTFRVALFKTAIHSTGSLEFVCDVLLIKANFMIKQLTDRLKLLQSCV